MALVTENMNLQASHVRKERDLYKRVVETCSQLKTYGVHSMNRMKTGGFHYTGKGDTAQCNICNLEVSGWNQQMDPFRIHLERSPNCSFVRSIQLKNQVTLIQAENSTKRQKTELNMNPCSQQNKLIELQILKQVRQRTFSHWPHQTPLTKDQMIDAGFFQCNVGDRVLCIYCNLICQKWNKDIDDPVEVHKTLSPQCPYVVSVLMQNEISSVFVVNGMSTDNDSNQTTLLSNANRLQCDQIVYTSPCHSGYTSIIDRQATFKTWTDESSSSVDNLVRAGFFYTGLKKIVTCFYCNGSLQNWGKNDDPLIEHIRWFPHCAYAKQLSGHILYNKVQEAKRFRQEREKSKISTTTAHDSSTRNNQQMQINDEKILPRLVAARLDLPVSQRLLDQNFKLSIIKRCWEDQLRLKHDDFITDCDLYIACIILQKQIEHINGNKDNIIVPSIKMESVRNNEQSDMLVAQQELSSSSSLPESSSTNSTSHSSVQIVTSDESMTVATTNEQTATEITVPETKVLVNNPCALCWKEEKRLACIPCGHLVACIGCSQTLRICPICRRSIEAFVRIYI